VDWPTFHSSLTFNKQMRNWSQPTIHRCGSNMNADSHQ
jgi:hypothetical protein